jgi:hypothetical protein
MSPAGGEVAFVSDGHTVEGVLWIALRNGAVGVATQGAAATVTHEGHGDAVQGVAWRTAAEHLAAVAGGVANKNDFGHEGFQCGSSVRLVVFRVNGGAAVVAEHVSAAAGVLLGFALFF